MVYLVIMINEGQLWLVTCDLAKQGGMMIVIIDTLREYRVPHGLPDPNPCSTAALQYIICLLLPLRPVWESWASSALGHSDAADGHVM